MSWAWSLSLSSPSQTVSPISQIQFRELPGYPVLNEPESRMGDFVWLSWPLSSFRRGWALNPPSPCLSSLTPQLIPSGNSFVTYRHTNMLTISIISEERLGWKFVSDFKLIAAWDWKILLVQLFQRFFSCLKKLVLCSYSCYFNQYWNKETIHILNWQQLHLYLKTIWLYIYFPEITSLFLNKRKEDR